MTENAMNKSASFHIYGDLIEGTLRILLERSTIEFLNFKFVILQR